MTERCIVIDVTLESLAGHAEELARLLRETQRLSQLEPGCIAYRFIRDLEDPDTFYAFELWADEQSIRDHAAAEPFRQFKARLPNLGRLVRSTWRAGPLEPFALAAGPEDGA